MRLSRVVMYGGSIGVLAAFAHFATEGVVSAAGLLVAAFAVLVMVGVSLAVLTEDAELGSWSAVSAAVRRVLHRRSLHELCGVCARVLTHTAPVRVCAECDRIPATIAR